MDLEWEKKVHEIVLLAQGKKPSELVSFLEAECGDEKIRREVETRLEGIRQVIENMRNLLG